MDGQKTILDRIDYHECNLNPVLNNQKEILDGIKNQKVDLSPLEQHLEKIEKEVIKGNREIEKLDTSALEKQLAKNRKGLKGVSNDLGTTNAKLTKIVGKL